MKFIDSLLTPFSLSAHLRFETIDQVATRPLGTGTPLSILHRLRCCKIKHCFPIRRSLVHFYLQVRCDIRSTFRNTFGSTMGMTLRPPTSRSRRSCRRMSRSSCKSVKLLQAVVGRKYQRYSGGCDVPRLPSLYLTETCPEVLLDTLH